MSVKHIELDFLLADEAQRLADVRRTLFQYCKVRDKRLRCEADIKTETDEDQPDKKEVAL